MVILLNPNLTILGRFINSQEEGIFEVFSKRYSRDHVLPYEEGFLGQPCIVAGGRTEIELLSSHESDWDHLGHEARTIRSVSRCFPLFHFHYPQGRGPEAIAV